MQYQPRSFDMIHAVVNCAGVQKPCRQASLITGALIGETGGVRSPGLLRVKEKCIWVLNWNWRQLVIFIVAPCIL